MPWPHPKVCKFGQNQKICQFFKNVIGTVRVYQVFHIRFRQVILGSLFPSRSSWLTGLDQKTSNLPMFMGAVLFNVSSKKQAFSLKP